jgi:hypothetical protein
MSASTIYAGARSQHGSSNAAPTAPQPKEGALCPRLKKKNRDTLDRTHRQATCRDAELTICLLDLMESLEDSRTLTHAEIMTYVMAIIRPSIPPRSSTPLAGLCDSTYGPASIIRGEAGPVLMYRAGPSIRVTVLLKRPKTRRPEGAH